MHPANCKRPLYQTLRNELAHDIARGRFPTNSLLPGTAELAAAYDASISTVTHALKLLAAEGLLRCRQGSRIRVLPAPRKKHWRIGVFVNCPDTDAKYDYKDGPWCWTLHQKILEILLRARHSALNLSYLFDWEPMLAQLDGVLALEANALDYDFAERLANRGIPCVNIGSWFAVPPENNTAHLDYAPACEQAAVCFLAHGCRHFLICLPPETASAVYWPGRWQPFLTLLREHGIPPEAIIGQRLHDDLGRALPQLRKLLRNLPKPIGVMTFGDDQAESTVREAVELGLQAKRDIFVIGTTGLPATALANPRLSVFAQPYDKFAKVACSMLFTMLENHTVTIPSVALPIHFTPFDT